MIDKKAVLDYVDKLCDCFDAEYTENADGTYTMRGFEIEENYSTAEDMLRAWRGVIEEHNECVESESDKVFLDVLEVIDRL